MQTGDGGGVSQAQKIAESRLLLNATHVNAYDASEPPKVRLPGLKSIFTRFEQQQPGPLYMCKLDLTGANWCIRAFTCVVARIQSAE